MTVKNLRSKLAVVVLAMGLAVPAFAGEITDAAKSQIAEQRKQQRVYEAVSLLAEKSRLEKRLAEIAERLLALDNNADPKRDEMATFSTSTSFTYPGYVCAIR